MSRLIRALRASISRGLVLRAVKEVRVRFMSREAVATALFDTGSGYTVIKKGFFERAFGPSWSPLPRPVKLYLVNRESVVADKYAAVTIVIDDYELLPPETVLVLDEFVDEIVVEGRKIKLPDVIIGAGTMDKYGITLDPREGVKVLKVGLLL